MHVYATLANHLSDMGGGTNKNLFFNIRGDVLSLISGVEKVNELKCDIWIAFVKDNLSSCVKLRLFVSFLYKVCHVKVHPNVPSVFFWCVP